MNLFNFNNISLRRARFTRSVAELQFLGLIKQAKHKADHVVRLTW